MGIEKEGSRNGGGYVGGFFQLFDWSAKSRKKLFSSKVDLPERSKQGKRSDGSFPMTRLNLMEEDEAGAGSSIRGSDYSCASSVTDDDGCGARAPGVVARLMGLDSMPMSSFSEPNTTPFFDTQSLQDASQRRKNFNYYCDHQTIYSGNLLKEDGCPRNFTELKPQKVPSRPIEKFQTEILPLKSAKSIPITQHRLLSPIKSPGFIPSKTAAHIMEAAAKIIDPTPQVTSKAKMHVVGSSSVHLKVRDLKEKLEVAQKGPVSVSSTVTLKVRDQKDKVEAAPKTSRSADSSRKLVESNAAKYLKGHSLNRSWNGSVDTTPVRAFPETEGCPTGLKNKEKSISLAIQAKVNVQRRGGLNSGSSGGSIGQKDQSEVMSGQSFKSQPSIKKGLHKKSSPNNAGGVLRQNNQKQNCLVDKDKLASKSSVSSLQARKFQSGSLSGRHKTSSKTLGSKVGSRKLGLEVTDGENGNANRSARNNTPRKKRSIDGNLHVHKNQIVDNTPIPSNLKAVEPSSSIDRDFSLLEESKKKGMDVVSFTFTAPLTRSMPGSEKSGLVLQKHSGSGMDNRGKRLLLETDGMKLPSVGYNLISGDALSSLLEQKLRELTKSVETSRPALDSSPVSRVQDHQNVLSVDKLGYSHDSTLFFTDTAAHRLKHRFQGADTMGEFNSKPYDSRKVLDCRGPSPTSVLEPSFSTESSSSLESTESCCTEGSKRWSSIQEQEVSALSSSNRFHYVDAEVELSDSASSTSTGTVARQHTLTKTEAARSTEWEVEYVKKIICNLEWMFQDFALGRASEVINPHLFYQMERRKERFESDGEARLERKVLFDCTSECLDIRCRQYIGGGCKAWVKGVAMVRRCDWLAKEVYEEISAWRGMGDCMVDELVDKDMSCQYGRWLDFEVDEFVLGAEVEGQIFNSLVDEVVADILRV